MKTQKVIVRLRKERWEVEPGQTAHQILLARHLNPERYLLICNGKVVDEQVVLQAGDELRLAAMISGGAATLGAQS
jgi:sulfur carrier protein ThiS